MAKEWQAKNEFNGFNSWKGLTYSEHYKAIAKGEFKVPIVANIDLTHSCNLKCSHCNAQHYLEDSKANHKKFMSDAHIKELLKFLKEWGVQAVSYVGGGEPSVHPYLEEAIKQTADGMKVGLITNGVALSDSLIKTIGSKCRWVGVSLDAGSARTYELIKKLDRFDVVIYHIKKLVHEARGYNCDVAIKYLVTTESQNEIYDACVIAKGLGVKDFHVRPADGYVLDVENISKQYDKCHEIETESFRVFTVQHKFKADFKPRHDYSQCYATPLAIQICADDNVYMCSGQRLNKDYLLGSHYPDVNNIKKFWGSEHHKNLVLKTGRAGCSERCTLSAYHTQCEKLYINNDDPMTAEFMC